MKNSKKGDIAAYQVVLFVLAIIGFLIVLLLWSTFKDTSDTSNQICHLSVLTRATSPQAAQSFVPLKCTTKKICLTMDSSQKCDSSFAGEKDISVVKLPTDTEKAARIVEQASAEAMYSCWDVMGRGKLDLFGNYAKYSGISFSDAALEKPYCVICSRVAVDDSVLEKKSNGKDSDILLKVNIYDYMKKNSPPGESLTYLQLFTDKQFSSYPVIDTNLFNEKIPNKTTGTAQIRFTRKEIAYVFMQIKSQDVSDVLSNLATSGAVVAGASFLTSPTRTAAGLIVTGGGVSAAIYKVAIIAG